MNDGFVVGGFVGILLLILLFILIFLVFREVITWYWKINKELEILQRIDNNLEYIARLLETEKPGIAKKVHDTEEESTSM